MAIASNKEYLKLVVTPFVEGKNMPIVRIRNFFQILSDANCQALLKILANKQEGHYALFKLINPLDFMPRIVGKPPFSNEKVFTDFRRLSQIGIINIVEDDSSKKYSLNREMIVIYADAIFKRFSQQHYLASSNQLILESQGNSVCLNLDLIEIVNDAIIQVQNPDKIKILNVLNYLKPPGKIHNKEIEIKTKFSKEKTSKYLKDLLQSGVVKIDKRGRSNYCSLNYDFLFNLVQLLHDFKSLGLPKRHI